VTIPARFGLIWCSGFREEDLNTKMAAKLKIEKRGDEILIVHCCFSISQNELKLKLTTDRCPVVAMARMSLWGRS
jgi:hypothetical protein